MKTSLEDATLSSVKEEDDLQNLRLGRQNTEHRRRHTSNERKFDKSKINSTKKRGEKERKEGDEKRRPEGKVKKERAWPGIYSDRTCRHGNTDRRWECDRASPCPCASQRSRSFHQHTHQHCPYFDAISLLVPQLSISPSVAAVHPPSLSFFSLSRSS